MPLYTPTEGLAVADLIEELAAILADAYTDAETRLLAELARRARRALADMPDLTARLSAVQELREHARTVLTDLDPDLALEVVRIASESGTAAAVARLNLAPRIAAPFTSTSAAAVAQVALDLRNTFAALHLRILRWDQDAYQRLISGHVPNVLLGVNGRLEAHERAVEQWLRDGIPGFVDKAGRSWRVGSYVEMATRTAVQRAFTDAGVARMHASGVDLVTIVVGASACKQCAAWIGKVLATSGMPGPRTVQHATDDRDVVVNVAATLDQARAAGLLHPNCRCHVAPYLPGLEIPASATMYDPVKERARDRQRSLERDIRQAKRDLDLTDDGGRRRELKSEIRDLQQRVREHTVEHDLPRKRNREQLRFADGRAA